MGDGARDLRVAGVEEGFLIGLVIRKSDLALQRPSIELMYRNCREVDAFETPKVDCSHTMALEVTIHPAKGRHGALLPRIGRNGSLAWRSESRE